MEERESAATMMLDSPPVGMTIPSSGSTRAGGVSARDGGALGRWRASAGDGAPPWPATCGGLGTSNADDAARRALV
jgi:hypothetical protein